MDRRGSNEGSEGVEVLRAVAPAQAVALSPHVVPDHETVMVAPGPPPPRPPQPGNDKVTVVPGPPAESERDVLTFDWSQKLTCACCSCFAYLMQLVLLACMGSFLFGFNLSLLNTSIGHIMWEYGWCDLDDDLTGCTAAVNYSAFMNTAVFIGAAIGSMTGGVFMRHGRRGMMLLSMFIFLFGIISSCVANSFSALLWARLCVGYAVGLVSVCVPSYMSEVTPPAVRGKYGVYHQLFITVGILVGTLIGLPLALSTPVPEGVPEEGQLHPEIDTFSMVWWRVMLGIAILPVLVNIYLLMKVYTFETPHYYIEKNHYADAEMLLRKILNKAEVAVELKEITDEIESGKRAAAAGMTLGAACGRPDFRWVIFYGCLLSAFQQLGGINVFIASSNELFTDAGLTGSMPTVMTVIMSLINCVMTLPAVFLIERLGRRTLMCIGTALMTLFVLPATICYWALEEGSDVTMWLAIVGCLGYIICFATTYGPILWVYLFEIYPTEIKGAAAGLATAFNWISGIVMVFVQNYLENDVLYLIFTIMCGIGFVIVFFGMKETKGRVLGDSPFIKKSQ